MKGCIPYGNGINFYPTGVVGPSSVWIRMEGSAGLPGGFLANKTSQTVCVVLSEEGSGSLRWSTPPLLCVVRRRIVALVLP